MLVSAALDGRFTAPFDNGIRNVFVLAGVIILITGLITIWGMRRSLIQKDLPDDVRSSIRETSHTFGSMRGRRRSDT